MHVVQAATLARVLLNDEGSYFVGSVPLSDCVVRMVRHVVMVGFRQPHPSGSSCELALNGICGRPEPAKSRLWRDDVLAQQRGW
jgi:hypothetical protein